ncbi:MAG TPA: P-loop NTPase fold protein [Gammaproteobacteria bacterium]|nr:P-loop NTPase fold protein [Gammaproteobacteria bacterium]
MKLKPVSIEVPKGDPFRNDALDRKESIGFLSKLSADVDPPFVICIDSPWGTGKSTFLKMWMQYQTADNVEPLYFNSWKTDFADDALVAFVSEVSNLVEAKIGKLNARHKRVIDNAKRVGSLLARRALPVLGKVATAGALDIEALQEEALAGLVEQTLKDSADAYLAEKDLIDQFHVALEELVNLFSAKDANARLLLMVDELDRCRPPYAIEMLERIKHLFDVPNVVFVLALDKSQMQTSLEAVYGRGINGAEYLRRFIDLEFSLPPADTRSFTKHLFREFSIPEAFSTRTHGEFQYEEDSLERTFNELCTLFNMSLRAREQCFTRIRIAMLSTPDDYHIYPILLTALIVLRTMAPEIYLGYVQDSGSAHLVIKYLLSLPGGEEFINSHSGGVLEALLVGARGRLRDESEELAGYRYVAAEEGADPRVRDRASFVLEMLKHPSSNPKLHYLLPKIELVARMR